MVVLQQNQSLLNGSEADHRGRDRGAGDREPVKLRKVEQDEPGRNHNGRHHRYVVVAAEARIDSVRGRVVDAFVWLRDHGWSLVKTQGVE